jgi:hypothetical protein
MVGMDEPLGYSIIERHARDPKLPQHLIDEADRDSEVRWRQRQSMQRASANLQKARDARPDEAPKAEHAEQVD